jgi:hypothetical protein
VPTGIRSSRWRSGCAHWDLDCEEEEAEEMEEEDTEAERRRTALIKSNITWQVGKKSQVSTN